METVQAWYQFAVNEILIGKLKWLLPLDGGYTMFHQDFEVYLAYRGELQKKQWKCMAEKSSKKKNYSNSLNYVGFNRWRDSCMDAAFLSVFSKR